MNERAKVGRRMVQLTPQELQETADEAGISPAELRKALAEQHGGLPAVVQESQGALLPAPKGVLSVAHVETSLAIPPDAAARKVRGHLEKVAGASGHMNGDNEARILDEERGVTYRIQTIDNEKGGALVRVDIDPSPRLASQKLRMLAGVGAGIVAIGLGLIVSPPVAIVGLLFAGLSLANFVAKKARGHATNIEAKAIASQALLESESPL